MRADGNGVDVDRTNANLAENQILFDTMMAIQTKKLHSLSSLITGAR
jgi:flagellar basal body rod protein FlgB